MRLKNERLIAERIRRELQRRDLSQKELAQKIGVQPSSFSRMLKGATGYVLTEQIIRDIAREFDLAYEDLTAVRPRAGSIYQEINEKYEGGIIMMALDKYGVDANHVRICDSIVYEKNKYTDFAWMSGDIEISPEQMEKIMRETGEVEEYYDMEYNGQKKRLSVNDYNSLIEMLNNNFKNSLDFVFAF